MGLEFAWPWLFAVLPLPLLVAWLMPRAPEMQDTALRVPFYASFSHVAAGKQSPPSRWRLLLAALAWVLLVCAAARPQFVGAPVHLPVTGRDLMLAVDISGSMATEDMQLGQQVTDRLTAVKAVAGNFIDHREGDRLGLILFGDQAYLQAPLTFDRETVRTLLNEAAIGLAGKSTAIGDAIGLAVKRLRERPAENRVLILLTDGANTSGSVDPLKAADLAAREGVRIYTIGVGADEQLVRGFFGTQRVPSTELDETTLKAIAEKTGGQYFRARDIESLQKIYALLDKLEPVSQDEQTFRPIHELYAWPLAGTLLLTALLALGMTGVFRRVGNIEVRHA
jgi:Ca-activated chloride channel family protein